MSNIRNYKFELEAVKDHYTDAGGFRLIDLIGYNTNIPKRDDGFLEKHAIFRCSVEEMMEAKETDKAIGITIGGDCLVWIPKSVIFDWTEGTKVHPCGFVVKEWFAKKNAQSGGPYYFLPKSLRCADYPDNEILRDCMETIGATPTEEGISRTMDADAETKKSVWEGILKSMRISDFDQYWTANAESIDQEVRKAANALWHIRSILLW